MPSRSSSDSRRTSGGLAGKQGEESLSFCGMALRWIGDARVSPLAYLAEGGVRPSLLGPMAPLEAERNRMSDLCPSRRSQPRRLRSSVCRCRSRSSAAVRPMSRTSRLPAFSGRKANLPAVPTLPAKAIKQGDAYTVYGAMHHLRSRVHNADVNGKDITHVGYIVKTNLADAPECAVHKTGKGDKDDCKAAVPAFWIADEKGDDEERHQGDGVGIELRADLRRGRRSTRSRANTEAGERRVLGGGHPQPRSRTRVPRSQSPATMQCRSPRRPAAWRPIPRTAS